MAAAARFAKLPQDCRVCRRPEGLEHRPRWGCDGPSTEGTLFEFDCVRCAGTDPKCGRCGGGGVERATRCPNAVVTQISWQVLEYLTLAELGILPVAGGWEDQSATFLQAFRFASSERAKIERRLEEAARKR